MSNIVTNFKNTTVDYEELLEEFKALLKENSLKFTVQREAILETLYNSNKHLTPESLHQLIKEKFPDLNTGIATIYRTLALLEDSNMVTSLSFGASGKKYELAAKKHHDHIICIKCKDIKEFVDEEIEKRQHAIADDLGFSMSDHSMQIYGICKNCKTE
jgi:Fur family transcriptional regulator, ferric uptake regulator